VPALNRDSRIAAEACSEVAGSIWEPRAGWNQDVARRLLAGSHAVVEVALVERLVAALIERDEWDASRGWPRSDKMRDALAAAQDAGFGGARSD
jgi:hypothetical protein